MSVQEWVQGILIGICIVCGLFMMACMLLTTHARKLRVVRKEVHSDGKDSACTFALISDLHVGKMIISWGNIVDALKESKPEFIVITGDLCNRLEETGRAACFIDLLASKIEVPVFITLGNHDNDIFTKCPELRGTYIRELEALSPLVQVLDSDYIIYKRVLIGGLNDVKSCTKDVVPLVESWGQQARDNDLSFLLATHNADMLMKLESMQAQYRPHLTVCGHTHGGQIHTPFNLEFKLLKKDQLPKQGYIYGSYDYKGFPLYITSGLGCSWLPLRLGSCGEIAIFHLC